MIMCLELTIEILEKGVKYVQVNNRDIRTTSVRSFRYLYCLLSTYFTPFSSDVIVDFKTFAGKFYYPCNHFRKTPFMKNAFTGYLPS